MYEYSFAYFNVHAASFDFCIAAFRYFESHNLQAGDCLILCQAGTLPKPVDIVINIHIWSDFLHYNPFPLLYGI